jgi:hypothetical protein
VLYRKPAVPLGNNVPATFGNNPLARLPDKKQPLPVADLGAHTRAPIWIKDTLPSTQVLAAP